MFPNKIYDIPIYVYSMNKYLKNHIFNFNKLFMILVLGIIFSIINISIFKIKLYIILHLKRKKKMKLLNSFF